MKINASQLAKNEDYEIAAQNNWMSVIFGWCAQDLERSLSLYKFETYWKPGRKNRTSASGRVRAALAERQS